MHQFFSLFQQQGNQSVLKAVLPGHVRTDAGPWQVYNGAQSVLLRDSAESRYIGSQWVVHAGHDPGLMPRADGTKHLKIDTKWPFRGRGCAKH
jgi:hypothetical protein